MVLDLIVKNTYDGFTAEVPSIKGCESWSKTEDEAIGKSIALLRFYLNLSTERKINIDKSRNENDRVIYKLIFKK